MEKISKTEIKNFIKNFYKKNITDVFYKKNKYHCAIVYKIQGMNRKIIYNRLCQDIFEKNPTPMKQLLCYSSDNLAKYLSGKFLKKDIFLFFEKELKKMNEIIYLPRQGV